MDSALIRKPAVGQLVVRARRPVSQIVRTAINKSNRRQLCLKLSAPEGIRTPNLLIRSQVLYPLSYGRNVYSVVELSSGGERI